MKIEARLIGTLPLAESRADDKRVILYTELSAWSKIFSPRYLRRTLIGVCMMFFQRASFIYFLLQPSV